MKKLLITGIFAAFGVASMAEVQDSIGQKFVDGKRYIEYKVGAKETLYSLSKKYNTSVAAIEASNGGLIQGLKKDATILIPVPKLNSVSTNASASGTGSGTASGSGAGVGKVPNTEKVVLNETVQALHVVSASETLYSISKKYGVSVEEIKSWNNLSSNEISLGQELKVSSPTTSEKVQLGTKVDKTQVVLKDDGQNGFNKDPGLDKIKIAESETVDKTAYTVDTSLYGEEVTESKTMGGITKVGVDQSKNLAQMTGVKPGTILMLVNPSNNKATFVRVIEGSSDGILVTNTVKKALGLSTETSPVIKVSYTK